MPACLHGVSVRVPASASRLDGCGRRSEVTLVRLRSGAAVVCVCRHCCRDVHAAHRRGQHPVSPLMTTEVYRPPSVPRTSSHPRPPSIAAAQATHLPSFSEPRTVPGPPIATHCPSVLGLPTFLPSHCHPPSQFLRFSQTRATHHPRSSHSPRVPGPSNMLGGRSPTHRTSSTVPAF